MDDARIWAFEEELWTGGAEVYQRKVDPACLMALPAEPFLFDGEAAIRAVSNTPRWESAEFTERHVSRPQQGLIVITYRISARRGTETYRAICSSTLRLNDGQDAADADGHDSRWTVIQHQQTPQGLAVSDT